MALKCLVYKKRLLSGQLIHDTTLSTLLAPDTSATSHPIYPRYDMTGKIDVDAHAVPAFFKEHLRALEGSGVPVVLCLLDATRAINSKLGYRHPSSL